MSGRRTRPVPLQRLSLPALIEDRFEAAIGPGAKRQGPLAGGFEAGLPVSIYRRPIVPFSQID